MYGENPGGSVIFTEDMHFNVVLHDPDVPACNTEDRSQGTYEELRAATKGALALYGIYVVDEQGDFAAQQVIGSTFPNWNGLHRKHDQLKLQRKGNRLLENLFLANGALVIIEWQLIED